MTPADPQYRNQRTVPVEDLAALIDGEITDMNRIEQLKSLLQGDTALSAEYDAQREVKLLLAELPKAEASSFMATRIMGEISSRKHQHRGLWVPKWGAAAAAVAVFGLGYGASLQFAAHQAGNAQMMLADKSVETPLTTGAPLRLAQDSGTVDTSTALNNAGTLVSTPAEPVDAFQTVYAASTAVDIPEDTDPWLREFIKLGNEAHNYSRAMRLTHNLAAPDVSQAVMVVDSR